MLIFFGTRNTVGNAIPTGQTCPGCGCPESIVAVPAQQYFHVFWIPMFPLTKNFTPVCSNCGGLFTEYKVGVPLEVKRQYKTPKWTFFGLAAIVIGITVIAITGSIASSKNKTQYNEYIDNPKTSDVYEVKLAPKEYSLMKVASFTSDSIYFYPHSEYTNLSSGIKKLSGADYLDEEYIEGYSKDELRKQLDDKTILKIKR